MPPFYQQQGTETSSGELTALTHEIWEYYCRHESARLRKAELIDDHRASASVCHSPAPSTSMHGGRHSDRQHTLTGSKPKRIRNSSHSVAPTAPSAPSSPRIRGDLDPGQDDQLPARIPLNEVQARQMLVYDSFLEDLDCKEQQLHDDEERMLLQQQVMERHLRKEGDRMAREASYMHYVTRVIRRRTLRYWKKVDAFVEERLMEKE